MGTGLIILYAIVSSVSMILYFNRLTSQQKKEIETITALNREKVLRREPQQVVG
jgi:hypothetical protein